MIDAARLQRCGSAFDLLQELGYRTEPVPIDADEWRRAGIDIGWNGIPLALATRTDAADVYVATGFPDGDAIVRFLRSLHAYNVLVKPVLVACASRRLAICDLSARHELRRLDIDLDDPSPHALDRLNLLVSSNGTDVARLFDRALDRDALTRQFFDRFRNSVRDVAEALGESFRGERHDRIAAQALLILSRLLFLYFIQQKGWLNGERRFLVDRLDLALRQGRDFFATVLRPLFFGCLNTPRDRRRVSLGAIPYLNGGLFEPSAFEQKHTEVTLPNDLMQRIIETTFERFAFTIDESDASGMHVDPEMLGKVFESLMADEERASSGSFYTPRAIVDVLTNRAIREWMAQWERDDPEDLVRRLQRITVIDPACGSGAFLLSALDVIEKMTAELGGTPSRQAIIERNLFGVDLKPEAVRLCELRLWLAIVARADMPIDAVPPLPNLDRNILQGNSLLSPTDFLGDARGDVYREWLYAIRAHSDLVDRYRNAPQHERPALARLLRASDRRVATELLAKAVDRDEAELRELSIPQPTLFGESRAIDSVRCRELQQRIRDSRKTLERVEQGEVDFFSFDVHFAHVMAANGFDVVAGNPPWVRNSRIDARTKRMLADRYQLFRARGAAAFHQPDLSVAFFERAMALSAPNGVVSMLVPSKLMNASYAAPLRRAALAHSIIALDDWSDERLFNADTFPLGLTVTRRRTSRRVAVSAGRESFTMSQDALSWSGSEWSLLPAGVQAIIERIRREHESLAVVLGRVPVMGVKTGDNSSFFVQVCRIRRGVAETIDGLSIPLRYLRRCVRGRDLKHNGDGLWMLWPPADGWLRIPRWLERLAELRGVEPDSLRLAYVRPEHTGLKVVWKDVSRGLAPVVLARDIIPNQTLYALGAPSIGDAQALAAVMSSPVFNALAVSIAERAKDFHYRYFGRTIARVPLPVSWRTAIDARELYGLTAAEHSTLARYLDRRLGYALDDD